MVLLAIHTVPVWNDDGAARIAHVGEARTAPVIGWANVMEVLLRGDHRYFLLVCGVDDGR